MDVYINKGAHMRIPKFSIVLHLAVTLSQVKHITHLGYHCNDL